MYRETLRMISWGENGYNKIVGACLFVRQEIRTFREGMVKKVNVPGLELDC